MFLMLIWVAFTVLVHHDMPAAAADPVSQPPRMAAVSTMEDRRPHVFAAGEAGTPSERPMVSVYPSMDDSACAGPHCAAPDVRANDHLAPPSAASVVWSSPTPSQAPSGAPSNVFFSGLAPPDLSSLSVLRL